MMVPALIAIIATDTPTVNEMRLPYNARDQMSLPMLSVPNQWPAVQGPVNLSRGAGIDGSDVQRSGAKIAITPATKNIEIPTAIFGCLFNNDSKPLTLSFIVKSGGFIHAEVDV